jgi:ABC-type transport system involved in cytochrome c biogenesis permease subunit
MFCGVPLGEEGQAVLAVFLVLVPATLYAMGMTEGKQGYRFFLAGLLVHAAVITLRGFTVGAVPLTEKYDNISFLAFSLALVVWYFWRRKGIPELALYALPLAATVLIFALAYLPINTISPFQRTPWFTLHMFFFFLSYGFFGVSSCIGVLYLLRKDGSYETAQYWSAIHGWIVLSLGLVTGSVWFFTAYGTYWLWTSKELWTTLVWFYYGMYLHARYVKGLTGRWAAVMGIAGFGVALFAYFGVGTIIPAPPTQF